MERDSALTRAPSSLAKRDRSRRGLLAPAPAFASFPRVPQTHHAHLGLEVSSGDQGFDLLAALTGPVEFHLGKAPRDRRGDGGIQAQLALIDRVESVGAGVVVGAVVRRILVRNQVRDAFHHEVEVVGTHNGRIDVLEGPQVADGCEGARDLRDELRTSAGEESRDAPGAS